MHAAAVIKKKNVFKIMSNQQNNNKQTPQNQKPTTIIHLKKGINIAHTITKNFE